jgi:adenylosuccinate synthase
VNNGIEHICSSFGSGVLLGVPTAYTEDFYFDPICFMNEYKVLKEKGIIPVYSLPKSCKVVTPVDTIVGIDNPKVRKDGTCGKGIYETFKRQQDTAWNYAVNGCSYGAKAYYNNAVYYHDYDPGKDYREAFINSFIEADEKSLAPIDIRDFDVVIFEGSQGLLLDMDKGFYPHVTPSRTGLDDIEDRYLNDAEVYLVTRAYLTRHGNGYTPIKPLTFDLSSKHETNVNNEFQGEFKTGALEIPLLNQAWQRHCMDNLVKRFNLAINLVVTHLDVFQRTLGGCDFSYIGRNGGYRTRKFAGPYEICHRLISQLDYKPDHAFYNDSIESNLHSIF